MSVGDHGEIDWSKRFCKSYFLHTAMGAMRNPQPSSQTATITNTRQRQGHSLAIIATVSTLIPAYALGHSNLETLSPTLVQHQTEVKQKVHEAC